MEEKDDYPDLHHSYKFLSDMTREDILDDFTQLRGYVDRLRIQLRKAKAETEDERIKNKRLGDFIENCSYLLGLERPPPLQERETVEFIKMMREQHKALDISSWLYKDFVRREEAERWKDKYYNSLLGRDELKTELICIKEELDQKNRDLERATSGQLRQSWFDQRRHFKLEIAVLKRKLRETVERYIRTQTRMLQLEAEKKPTEGK